MRDARRVSLSKISSGSSLCDAHITQGSRFTMTAVVTLALGIGANADLQRRQCRPASRLPYQIRKAPDTAIKPVASRPQDIQKQAGSFAAVAAWWCSLSTSRGRPSRFRFLPGFAMPSLQRARFSTAIGVFSPPKKTATRPGPRGAHSRILDAHLRRDPTILGKAIRLSGNSYTVIGVLHAVWLPGRPVDAARAIRVEIRWRQVSRRPFLRTYFRLKAGVATTQARAEMETIDQWLTLHYPEENTNTHRRLLPLRDAMRRRAAELLVLFAAVGLVLLIACVNLPASTGRSATRQREIAFVRPRRAFGPAYQANVTESVLLSLLGGAAGWFLLDLACAFDGAKTAGLPRIASIRSMLGSRFHVAVSLLTGIVSD